MDQRQLHLLKEQNPFAPLHTLICDLLMQDIINYRILPGSRLVESAIAERFGVSRSPVRMAVEVLVEKGYVDQVERHYYVKAFSAEECKNLSDLSFLIEPYAAGEAAERLTAGDLDTLFDMAYQLQRLYHEATSETVSGSFMPLMDLEHQFHSLIINASGNAVIASIYEQYRYRILYYRSYILQNPPRDVLDVLADDHILICNTLKLRDREMAAAVVKRHLSVSQHVIRQSQVTESEWGKEKDITGEILFQGNQKY